MADCLTCGGRLERRHRSAMEKVLYAHVFECRQCHNRVRLTRRALRVGRLFLFSQHTCCPRCGSDDVKRESKRDRIDSASKHIVSRVQGWFGAPLNKCPACRLQYHDWRPLAPAEDD